MAHQAEMVGLGGRERVTGQDHLHGLGVGNLALEPHGRTRSGNQPQLGLGQPEHRVLLGNPDIGLLQHFTATAQTRSVDRGDQRLAQRTAQQ